MNEDDEEDNGSGDLTDDDAYDEYGQPLDLAAIARAVNDAALNRAKPNNDNTTTTNSNTTVALVPPGPMPAIRETADENNSTAVSVQHSRSHSPSQENNSKNSFLNFALNVPGLGTLDPNTSINTSTTMEIPPLVPSSSSGTAITTTTTEENGNDENMTFYVVSSGGENKPDKRYAMMVRKSKLHKLTIARIKKNLSAAVGKEPTDMILQVVQNKGSNDTNVELQDTWSGADIKMTEGSELRLTFRSTSTNSTNNESTGTSTIITESNSTANAGSTDTSTNANANVNLDSLSSLLPPPPPPAPPSRKKGKSKLRQLALAASMFGGARNLSNINSDGSPATITGLASVTSVNSSDTPSLNDNSVASPPPALSKLGGLFGKKTGGGGGMLAALKAAAAAQEASKKQAEEMNDNPSPATTKTNEVSQPVVPVATEPTERTVSAAANDEEKIVNSVPLPSTNNSSPPISQRLDKRMRIRQLFNQLANADELMFGTISSSPNSNPYFSYQDDGGVVGRADLAATLSADIEVSTWPEYENLITNLLATAPSDIITWNEFSILFIDISDGRLSSSISSSQTGAVVSSSLSASSGGGISSLPIGIAVPRSGSPNESLTNTAASSSALPMLRSPSSPLPSSPGTGTNVAFSPNNKNNNNLSPVPVPVTAASVRARKAREVVVEVEDGPEGNILDLVVRTGENPHDIANDFVIRHGMASEDAPALVELMTPRLLQAYTIELADTRKALFDTLQALEIANNRLNTIENNPNIITAAVNASANTAAMEAANKIAATEARALEAETALSAEKVVTNDLRNQIELAATTAATALKEQAEALSLLSATQTALDQVTNESQTKINQLTEQLEACKIGHREEMTSLQTTLIEYENKLEKLTNEITALQTEIDRLKAEMAEKGKRRTAWERYVDGAEASGIGSSDAALNAITNSTPGSDRRSNTASVVASLQQGDWRMWAAEKREILARANADRAALIEENKRIRTALDSGGLDAEAKLRAQDEEKARYQAEITTITAARNRAEAELRSVYKAWEEDGRRWAQERKTLYDQLETSTYGGGGGPTGNNNNEDFTL